MVYLRNNEQFIKRLYGEFWDITPQRWTEATQDGVDVLRSSPSVLKFWGALEDFKCHLEINIFSGH